MTNRELADRLDAISFKMAAGELTGAALRDEIAQAFTEIAEQFRKTPDLKRASFSAPTVKEILQQCIEMDYDPGIAEDFWSFYESKNWMVGKSKMTKWKVALGRWAKANGATKEQRDDQQSQPTGGWGDGPPTDAGTAQGLFDS